MGIHGHLRRGDATTAGGGVDFAQTDPGRHEDLHLRVQRGRDASRVGVRAAAPQPLIAIGAAQALPRECAERPDIRRVRPRRLGRA